MVAEPWRLRRLRAHGALAFGIAVVAAVAIWPAIAAAVPACPVREYFGILCPGCGGTRALIALLHGRLAEAVRLNALVVCLLPMGLWFTATTYVRAVKPGLFDWPRLPAVALFGIAAAGVVFAIARNVG